MAERKRVDRVDLGVFDSKKMVNIYAKEFSCVSAGKVAGDLDAETAEIKGSCKVEGDVKTLILKIGGAMKVEGNVNSELIRAKGSFKVEGDIRADHFRVTGATKVEGGIESSEEIMVMGVLKCDGHVNANKFNLLGVVDVSGRLKACSFTADLGGKSTVKELESDIIRIKLQETQKHGEFISRRIIGKDIYLEATTAERVEGEKVIIGPGCAIAEVKASQLEVHKGSKVGKRIQ